MARTYRAISNRQARRAGITPVGRLDPVSRETDEPQPVTVEADDDDEISYRELQAAAKARGINARQSREDLEAALNG